MGAPVFKSSNSSPKKGELELPMFEVADLPAAIPAPAVEASSSTPHAATTSPEEELLSYISGVAIDDCWMVRHPKEQCDYLSHDWKEEEIWRSWRYIVNKRYRFRDSDRLENAVWRTWLKSMEDRKPVDPKLLNWHKDADALLLLGPLVTADKPTSTPPQSPRPSSTCSNKRPILKKKRFSEEVFQRVLSNDTLVNLSDAIYQKQRLDADAMFSTLKRTNSDQIIPSDHIEAALPAGDALTGSFSVPASPGGERRIAFDNEVKQCIGLEYSEEEEEKVEQKVNEWDDYVYEGQYCLLDDDNSSEDSLVTMPHLHPQPSSSNYSTPRSSFSSDTRPIIAQLPSTTLKFNPEDLPDADLPPSPTLSRTSSLETLRPSTEPVASRSATPTPRHYSLRDVDPFEDGGLAMGDSEVGSESEESSSISSISWLWRRLSPGLSSPLHDTSDTAQRSISLPSFSFSPPASPTPELDDRLECLSTPGSSVFTPFGYPFDDATEDESEQDDELQLDDPATPGVLGQVVDTVNTVRDIAHVIWYVGWRR